MTRTRLGAATLLAVALPLLEACGGEPPAAATPPQPQVQAENSSTPEDALAAVEAAEHTLDQLVGPAPASSTVSPPAGGAAPSVQASAAPPPPPPPAPPRAAPAAPVPTEAAPPESARRASKSDGYGLRQKAPDSCTTACGALASMERATEHLCALAGADDVRCTSARDRVKGASARVRAVCPVCGG
jgi:predicted RNA-binding Zn-ribbon protein involved in translation (DUF1610 family)